MSSFSAKETPHGPGAVFEKHPGQKIQPHTINVVGERSLDMPGELGREPLQCNFYHHACANTSKLFVSHRTTDTIKKMLTSLQDSLQSSTPLENLHHDKDSALTTHSATGEIMTEMAISSGLIDREAEYSCVDIGGTSKNASQPAAPILQPSEVHEEPLKLQLSRTTPAIQRKMATSENPEDFPEQIVLQPHSLTNSVMEKSLPDSTVIPSPLLTPESQGESCASLGTPQAPTVSTRWSQWAAPLHTPDHSFVHRQVALLAHRQVLKLLDPLSLSCGSYVSMFASNAEYSRHTQCFRAVTIAKKNVVHSWVSLVHCAALSILQPRVMNEKIQLLMALKGKTVPPKISPIAGRRYLSMHRSHAVKQSHCSMDSDVLEQLCDTLQGIYVYRIADSSFELGVIMYSGHQDPRILCLLECFSHWCNVSIEDHSVVLPICSSMRCVSLNLCWMPQQSRVKPGCPLPPIKVIVKDDSHSRLADLHGSAAVHDNATGEAHHTLTRASLEEHMTPLFESYNNVVLFLVRPVTSRLCGTHELSVPHSWGDFADPQRGDNGKAREQRSMNPCDTSETQNDNGRAPWPPRPISALQSLVRLSNGTVQATLLFADNSVTRVGEHLLAVEMQPKADYRPFVPTLYANLAPFLVVGAEEA